MWHFLQRPNDRRPRRVMWAGLVLAALAGTFLSPARLCATDFNIDYPISGYCQDPMTLVYPDFGGVALVVNGSITPTASYINAPFNGYKFNYSDCNGQTYPNWSCYTSGQNCIAHGNMIHVGVSAGLTNLTVQSAFLYNLTGVACAATTRLDPLNTCAGYTRCDVPHTPGTASIEASETIYQLLSATSWQAHADGKSLTVLNQQTSPPNDCPGPVFVRNVRFEYYTTHQPLSTLNATAVRHPIAVDSSQSGPFRIPCNDSMFVSTDAIIRQPAGVGRPAMIAAPPPDAKFVVVTASQSLDEVPTDATTSRLWLEEAILGPHEHLLTPGAGPHGRIDPGDPIIVTDGATQAFTISPDAGYRVADVLVDGSSVGAVATYTFSNVTANHWIVATFALINLPPDCSQATAVPSELWPPNHRLVPVSIGGITDPDGDAVTVTVTRVTQDEPVDGHGSDCGSAVVDGSGVQLRAERDGNGNGRVYTVWYTATDAAGDSCSGSVKVCVPHDRAHLACEDDGRNVDILSHCGDAPRDRVGKRENLPVTTLGGTSLAGNAATLDYSLASAGVVRISVYDIAGRRVATVEDAPRAEGSHKAVWSTAHLARGIYFYRLQSGSATITKALLILR